MRGAVLPRLCMSYSVVLKHRDKFSFSVTCCQYSTPLLRLPLFCLESEVLRPDVFIATVAYDSFPSDTPEVLNNH